MQGREYSNVLQAVSTEGYNKIVKLLLDKYTNINIQGGEYSNTL
jgi:hypothetical protein